MNRIALFSAVLLFASLLGSCQYGINKRVRGNGHIVTVDKPIGRFTSVHSSTFADIRLKQGTENSVRIEAEENLIDYIVFEIKDNKLVIDTRSNISLSTNRSVIVYITSPVYEQIILSGSGEVNIDGRITNTEKLSFRSSGSGEIQGEVDAPVVDINVSGSGDINISGQTKDVKLSITGSCNGNLGDLKAENADIQISGSGDAIVQASIKLVANITGSGDVRYKGNPPTVTKTVTGSGEVRKL
jgi:Putative auto-transporter adhesin, head GIN domain